MKTSEILSCLPCIGVGNYNLRKILPGIKSRPIKVVISIVPHFCIHSSDYTCTYSNSTVNVTTLHPCADNMCSLNTLVIVSGIKMREILK